MRKKPEVLQTETIARTRIFSIEQRQLRFSNGRTVNYERVTGSQNGSVLIIPVLNDDTLLLIREYAAGVHRYELGLPKGRLEDDEAAIEAANREIMEEVGYAANSLELLRTMTLAPGYLGSSTHIVLARDLYPAKRDGDEPEEIEVVPWPLARLDELLSSTELTEARTIAALYLLRDRLHDEQ
ncbi:MAG: ADP compounds hydrolase NudE [Granulosicoccaceae bacterium]|jgi:ADP-ribose diphosphatase